MLSLLYGPTLTSVHDPVIKAPSQNSIFLFCGELSTALHTPGELDKAEDIIPVLKWDPGPVRPGRCRTQGGSGLCEIYVVDIRLNLKLHRPHWSGDTGIRDGGTGGSFQGEASFRVQRWSWGGSPQLWGGSTEFCRFLITCGGFYWATLFLGHRSGSALTSMHKPARQDWRLHGIIPIWAVLRTRRLTEALWSKWGLPWIGKIRRNEKEEQSRSNPKRCNATRTAHNTRAVADAAPWSLSWWGAEVLSSYYIQCWLEWKLMWLDHNGVV